jgi:hypothetical protein
MFILLKKMEHRSVLDRYMDVKMTSQELQRVSVNKQVLKGLKPLPY